MIGNSGREPRWWCLGFRRFRYLGYDRELWWKAIGLQVLGSASLSYLTANAILYVTGHTKSIRILSLMLCTAYHRKLSCLLSPQRMQCWLVGVVKVARPIVWLWPLLLLPLWNRCNCLFLLTYVMKSSRYKPRARSCSGDNEPKAPLRTVIPKIH